MILHSRTRRPWARSLLAGVWLAVAAGCAATTSGAGDAPLSAERLPSSDDLLGSPELQEVVDLQVARNGGTLIRLLENPDPTIRARAALALASVQDQNALDPLGARLADPDALVRRNAAFALGHLALPDGGSFLFDALLTERDPSVRRALVETIGQRGGTRTVESLLGLEVLETDEPAWTMALASASLREVRPEGIVDRLVSRLSHEDAEVRQRAAYYFGRTPNVDAWRHLAPAVRERLDSAQPDDPAAMHLVSAIGRLGEVEEDASRLADWLRGATDWRTRVNAATGVRSPRWMESEVVREAVVAALDDPMGHVRTAAAEALAMLMWGSEDVFQQAVERVAEGSPESWRVQAAFLSALASQGELPLVLDWLRRMAEARPEAAARGIEIVGRFPQESIRDLLFEMVDHPDPLVRSSAVAALAGRLTLQADLDALEPYYQVFSRVVLEDAPLPAVRAANALVHPSLQPLGAADVLEEAFIARRDAGNTNLLLAILTGVGEGAIPLLREVVEDADPRLRAAAARSLERLTGSRVLTTDDGEVPPEIDWGLLRELGPAPRVRIVTDQGELVVRLLADQAPLTVQTFVENARRGSYDGTRFHRVIPNFVAQGGDFTMGDGSGDPGYRIVSEFTQLHFERGVLGMASSGKDTESSQFYITHSMQPHLNGGYTAFGWLEEGGDVLDRIQQDDRVVRMELLDG